MEKNMKNTNKAETKKAEKTGKKIKALKPETIREKAKIVNLSDFFVIFKAIIESVSYMIGVSKKSEENTRPFALISLDNKIARKESKDITSLLSFCGLDLSELNNTIFSDVKRINKGTYQINPIYSGILYPLFYRYENRIAQKLDAENYIRMINRFISAELYALVSADYDLKEQAEKNLFTFKDVEKGILTFNVKK